MENIIITIIFIIWIISKIYNTYQKEIKNAKNKPKPITQNYDTPDKQTKNINKTPQTKTTTKQQTLTPKQKPQYTSYENLTPLENTDNSYDQNPNLTTLANTTDHYNNYKTDSQSEENEHITNIIKDFSLPKAIIYSEIINRKYN